MQVIFKGVKFSGMVPNEEVYAVMIENLGRGQYKETQIMRNSEVHERLYESTKSVDGFQEVNVFWRDLNDGTRGVIKSPVPFGTFKVESRPNEDILYVKEINE